MAQFKAPRFGVYFELAMPMPRKFWQIESLHLHGNALRVELVELTSNANELAPPVIIAGMEITGHELKVGAASERVVIAFPNVTEFRAEPEQCSWPIYEDSKKVISCLLYEKAGPYYYGKDCPQGRETFDSTNGWVEADRLKCYIVHSESFDIYVLSGKPPIVSQGHQHG